MNKIITFVFCCLLLTGLGALHADDVGNYPPLTDQQKASFYGQLEDQTTLTQQKLKELENRMGNPDLLMSPALKIEIKRTAEAAKVKEILASEFVGKQSLRSPRVRQILLDVMSKDDIQPQDIERLQEIVDREKAKIAAYDQQQAQQAAQQAQQDQQTAQQAQQVQQNSQQAQQAAQQVQLQQNNQQAQQAAQQAQQAAQQAQIEQYKQQAQQAAQQAQQATQQLQQYQQAQQAAQQGLVQQNNQQAAQQGQVQQNTQPVEQNQQPQTQFVPQSVGR